MDRAHADAVRATSQLSEIADPPRHQRRVQHDDEQQGQLRHDKNWRVG